MKNFLIINTLFLPFFLTGCGLDFYLHPELKDSTLPVHMKVGEKRLAISQIDCVSLAGGYYPGLISSDVNIVSVVKDSVICGDKVYLMAKKEGVATMCYIPFMKNGEQTHRADLTHCQEESFKVYVTN